MTPAANALAHQFIFIVGAPRSGTTWLHHMLAHHPQVASVEPELTWFSRYAGPALGNFERERAHMDRKDWDQGLPVLFTPEEFLDGLQRITGAVYERVARTKPGATHILDKHPNYANHMDAIARVLPTARFVHIIRDGRDVSASMISASQRVGFGAGEATAAARDWDRFTRNAMDWGRRHGPQRYHEVRYEDLIKDDGSLLLGIIRFIGLPIEPEEARAIIERNAFGKKTFSSADPKRTKDPSRSWKDRLGLFDRYRIHRAAGPLLLELGYARSGWWADNTLQRLMIGISAGVLPFRRACKAAWVAFRQGD